MSNPGLYGRIRWAPVTFEPLAFHKREGLWWRPGPEGIEGWYARCQDQRTIKRLADMGVNLVSTHFFKGYGLRSACEDHDGTGQVVSLCHRNGIRVLGYVQMRSLMPEQFLLEVPEASGWMARDRFGRHVTYNGTDAAYYRIAPCRTNPRFTEYVKEVVREGLAEAGLDGFHVDNLSIHETACYCDVCREAFRGYLRRKYDRGLALDVYGFDDFSLVEPPAAFRAHDPLARDWVEFKARVLEGLLRDLAGYARSLKPDCIFAVHVRFPWHMAGDYLLKWSVAPELLLDQDDVDLGVCENYSFPLVKGAEVVSLAREYKLSRRAETPMIPFAWLPREGRPPGREGGISAIPEPDEAAVMLCEQMACGGQPVGALWSTEPLGEGMAFEDARLGGVLSHAFRFSRDMEDWIAGFEPFSDVACVRSTRSLLFTFEETSPAVCGVEELLLRSHVQFDMLLDRDLDPGPVGGTGEGLPCGGEGGAGRLSRYRAVILPGVTCLSDRAAANLRAYVRGGGILVVTGNTGLLRPDARRRPDFALAELTGVSVGEWPLPLTRSGVSGPAGGAGMVLYLGPQWFAGRDEGARGPQTGRFRASLPRDAADMRRLLLGHLGPLAVTVDAPEHVFAYAYRGTGPDGRPYATVHLVDYAHARRAGLREGEDRGGPDVSIRVAVLGAGSDEALLFRYPDSRPEVVRPLGAVPGGACRSWKIGEMGVYAILSVPYV